MELPGLERLVYAYQHKITVQWVLKKKPKPVLDVQGTEIQPGYYQERDREVYDLRTWIQDTSLEELYDTFQIHENELIMMYYSVFGETEELHQFMEKYAQRDYTSIRLEQNYKTWKEIKKNEWVRTEQLYHQYQSLQNWLSTQPRDPHFQTSPIHITSMTLEGRAGLRVATPEEEMVLPVTPSYGFDIFLQSFSSDEIPLIFYKGGKNDEVMIKTYTGDLGISYDKIRPSDQEVQQPHTIHMVVWNELEKSRKTLNSFSIVLFDLQTKEATFDIRNISKASGEDVIVQRIQYHTPLTIEQIHEKNLFGEISLYGLELSHSLYLDMLLNDLHASQLSYMNESSSPYSIKHRIQYHLRIPSMDFEQIRSLDETSYRYFSYISYQEHASETTVAPVLDYFSGTQGSVRIREGTPILRLNITYSYGRDLLQMGVMMTSWLISIFQGREEELRTFYKTHGVKIPEPKRIPLESVQDGETFLDKSSYEPNLSSAAPHIFQTNYKRRICQNVEQPWIVPKNLRDQWDREHPRIHQQAVPFPPKNPEFYVGCPSENRPYVSMKTNTLPNRDTYPYLPCCTKEDTQKPGRHSAFTAYYLNEVQRTVRTDRKKPITSKRFLRVGQKGFLPDILQATLDIFQLKPHPAQRGRAKESYYGRLGVSEMGVSPDRSALHAVFTAMAHSDYLQSKNRDQWVDRELQKPFETSYLLQELYDYRQKEIREKVQEDFFDTWELYRWLELYGVQVFVFYTEDWKEVEMEIPRHLYFHSRIFRETPCVLLFKHWENRKKELDHPHYELITRGKQMLWKPQEVYEIFQETNSTYELSFREKTILRRSPYEFDPLKFFPNARSQYVDVAGKCRGVTVPMKRGKEDATDRMTILFTPTQPLRLPMEREQHIWPRSIVEAQFVDAPSQYSVMKDRVSGVWYQLYDNPEGLFVPVQDEPVQPFMKIGRGDPYQSFGEPIVERIKNIERMRDIYLQTLLWAFRIWLQDRTPRPDDVDAFSSYLVLDTFDWTDSLRGINTSLLDTRDFDEAMGYLEDYFPYVQDGSFLCVNETMKERVVYFLSTYVDRFRHLEELRSLREEDHTDEKDERTERTDELVQLSILRKLYQEPVEFTKGEKNIVFMNLEQFKIWIFEESTRISTVFLHQTLDIKLSMEKMPYVYQDPYTQRIFLIQNVGLGERERAVEAGKIFLERGVNPGFHVPPNEDAVEVSEYGISPSGDLILLRGSGTGIRILQYNEHVFGALLQIV